MAPHIPCIFAHTYICIALDNRAPCQTSFRKPGTECANTSVCPYDEAGRKLRLCRNSADGQLPVCHCTCAGICAHMEIQSCMLCYRSGALSQNTHRTFLGTYVHMAERIGMGFDTPVASHKNASLLFRTQGMVPSAPHDSHAPRSAHTSGYIDDRNCRHARTEHYIPHDDPRYGTPHIVLDTGARNEECTRTVGCIALNPRSPDNRTLRMYVHILQSGAVPSPCISDDLVSDTCHISVCTGDCWDSGEGTDLGTRNHHVHVDLEVLSGNGTADGTCAHTEVGRCTCAYRS